MKNSTLVALTSEILFADWQDVIAALQPSITVGNAAGNQSFYHNSSAPSANQDESQSTEARAVVNQINHLDLRPFTAQNHYNVSLLQFSTAINFSKFIIQHFFFFFYRSTSLNIVFYCFSLVRRASRQHTFPSALISRVTLVGKLLMGLL
jgi:hypothetical protein